MLTPRYRIVPLLSYLFAGCFFGLNAACWIGLPLIWLAEYFELPDFTAILLLIALGALFLFFVYFAVAPELDRQRAEYRVAINRCIGCGYSLAGIRGSAQACPECGKPIKPIK